MQYIFTDAPKHISARQTLYAARAWTQSLTPVCYEMFVYNSSVRGRVITWGGWAGLQTPECSWSCVAGWGGWYPDCKRDIQAPLPDYSRTGPPGWLSETPPTHTHTHTHRAHLFAVWSGDMTTRGGCVIELHLHLGNPAVGIDSSFSMPPVPVWRGFPEGTSGVFSGGSGTGYTSTDQGTLHRMSSYYIISISNQWLLTFQKDLCALFINNSVVFLFQLSLKGPPGPLGLTGRPGPLVRHLSDLDQNYIKGLQPFTSTSRSVWQGTHSTLSFPS